MKAGPEYDIEEGGYPQQRNASFSEMQEAFFFCARPVSRGQHGKKAAPELVRMRKTGKVKENL